MSRSSSRPPPSSSYAASVLPDGPVDGEVAEIFSELVDPSPQHELEATLVDDETDAAPDNDASRPWYKRPSPWWLLVATPVSTIAMSMTLAPKVEIYTLLACLAHKPEIFEDMRQHQLPPLIMPPPQRAPTRFPALFDVAIGKSTVNLMKEYPVEQCSADPVVQKAVAKLNTAIVSTMGVLGLCTTGWWGSFSDRHGRTKLLTLTLLGVLFNDFVFIFTTKNFWWLGGYWFLLAGPILEGLLGGFTTGSAVSHAYLSDVVTPAERSRVFSLFLGVVFTGLGLGPTIGGQLIKYTDNLLSVFYFAACCHGTYAILSATILPESLSKRRMESAKAPHAEAARLDALKDHTFLRYIQRLFGFLRPLMVFSPLPHHEPQARKRRRGAWDWNLALMAVAYGFAISIMGSLGVKMQYMMQTFHWESEAIGYFLTIMGATRAIFMALVLPFAIKLVRRFTERRRTQTPTETQPLLESVPKAKHSPSFDLGLARVSLVIDIIAYALMPLAQSGGAFVGATMITAFGTGFTPAVQSVSLELYARKNGQVEAGKLFGALSVVQALGGQILGPAVYGLVFVKTVATFPKAIFFVSLGSVIVALVCMCLVRLPKDVAPDAESETSAIPSVHPERDATLVDIEAEGSAHSGNKPIVPQVVVSAPSDL